MYLMYLSGKGPIEGRKEKETDWMIAAWLDHVLVTFKTI